MNSLICLSLEKSSTPASEIPKMVKIQTAPSMTQESLTRVKKTRTKTRKRKVYLEDFSVGKKMKSQFEMMKMEIQARSIL